MLDEPIAPLDASVAVGLVAFLPRRQHQIHRRGLQRSKDIEGSFRDDSEARIKPQRRRSHVGCTLCIAWQVCVGCHGAMF
jgi:hypothetical protein